ncbi:MAG: LTA synthase family protein [Roseburia sp.]
MKRKTKFVIGNIALVVFGILLFAVGFNYTWARMQVTCRFDPDYGNVNGEEAAVYWAAEDASFSSGDVRIERIEDNQVTFDLPRMDMQDSRWRLEICTSQSQYAISEFWITYGGKCILWENAAVWYDSVEDVEHCTVEISDDVILCYPDGETVSYDISEGYTERLCTAAQKQNRKRITFVMMLVYLFYGLCIVAFAGRRTEPLDRKKYILTAGAVDIFFTLGMVLLYAERYLKGNFGTVDLGQLIYHIRAPLEGTNMSVFYGAIRNGVILAIACIILLALVELVLCKMKRDRGFLCWLALGSVLLYGLTVVMFDYDFDMVDYFIYTHQNSTIYEDYYVDGREVELTFPEEKRNLIYIYLESMETTYADTASGGAMGDNYIPELTRLASENIDFSQDEEINGAYAVSGAGFTMGALVAQTAGVPINENLFSGDMLDENWDSENTYLPGAWTIGDILQEQNYHQVFMIGSNGAFAGRASYFRSHGDYEILDYDVAVENGWIPSDYYVWWGYEDEKLIAFAKEEILALAAEDEPFNFTMLTADTHFTGGYVCDLCENNYEQQYSNVIACSDKQIAEFVQWIKEQDFYGNTTIVIVGDHPTMDSAYIEEEGALGYDRKAYFTLINPAEGCSELEQYRVYSTLDMMPTTLAAMGVSIEGNRLGLGVNLFSQEPTLCEELGIDELNVQLKKNSKLYSGQLLYSK